MQIVGNYTLSLTIGESVVEVQPHMIGELKIVLDIDYLLPTFTMSLLDSTRLLGDITPFDKSANTIGVEISRSDNLSNLNLFEFAVKRRNVQHGSTYTVHGLLDVPNLVTQEHATSYSGNIKTNLETMASENWDITDTEIGGSLDYEKSFVQPHWPDGKLIQYLKQNLVGRNDEAGYYAFIKNIRGTRIFVFKSISEIFLQEPEYKLVVSHRAFENMLPIWDYAVYDNSQFLADFGAQQQEYVYFDYNTGAFVSTTVDIEDCPTLSEFYLVDSDRGTDSHTFTKTGRSNDFTADFKGRVQNTFFHKNTELIHMWVTTWGLENIAPGDVVQIMFGDNGAASGLFLFQHSGYWMVKRVVHKLKNTFTTSLLLCRAGVDTDIETTLKESTKRKR